MPELPEIETILCGIRPYCEGQKIKKITVRHPALRWPIPDDIDLVLQNKKINFVKRRGKYLLFNFNSGFALLHLGMSGRLRILSLPQPPQKHDHFDIVLENNIILRYTDPRRFGAFLWSEQSAELHPLLKHLGLEPLDRQFSGKYLWLCAQGRNIPIKSFIMDNKIVVGVGNIYASEALFKAKISPLASVKSLSENSFNRLSRAIRFILKKAIKQGGTTFKDFLNSQGAPGYFAQHLQVYGRAGLACTVCHLILTSTYINQRNTVFCPQCQKI